MEGILISKKNSFLQFETEEERCAKTFIQGRTRRANSENLGMTRLLPRDGLAGDNGSSASSSSDNDLNKSPSSNQLLNMPNTPESVHRAQDMIVPKCCSMPVGESWCDNPYKFGVPEPSPFCPSTTTMQSMYGGGTHPSESSHCVASHIIPPLTQTISLDVEHQSMPNPSMPSMHNFSPDHMVPVHHSFGGRLDPSLRPLHHISLDLEGHDQVPCGRDGEVMSMRPRRISLDVEPPNDRRRISFEVGQNTVRCDGGMIEINRHRSCDGTFNVDHHLSCEDFPMDINRHRSCDGTFMDINRHLSCDSVYNTENSMYAGKSSVYADHSSGYGEHSAYIGDGSVYINDGSAYMGDGSIYGTDYDDKMNRKQRYSFEGAHSLNPGSTLSPSLVPSDCPSTPRRRNRRKANSSVTPTPEDARRIGRNRYEPSSAKVVLNLDGGLLPPKEHSAGPTKWEPAMHGYYAKKEILETEHVDERDRTTVMMKNIPNKYTQEAVMELIHAKGFKTTYDFLYLPIDFRSKSNMGYAFINFTMPEDAQRFIASFTGFRQWHFNSVKVCEVTWSRPYQGLAAHIDRYRNSPTMHSSIPQEFKPTILFAGQRLPFPPPTRLISSPKRKDFMKEL